MSNYPLTNIIKEALYSASFELTNRPVLYAQHGFPLSREDIQEVVLPLISRQYLEKASYEGVNTIGKTNVVVFSLKLERWTKIKVNLLEDIFYRDYSQVDEDIGVDPEGLPPEAHAKLVAWGIRALDVSRRKALARHTIREFLQVIGADRGGMSTGMIAARWPGLSVLFQHLGDETGTWRRRRSNPLSAWKERMQTHPRALGRWTWEYACQSDKDWHTQHKKAMLLTDQLLTQAMLLPEQTVSEINNYKRTTPVWAVIHSWDKNGVA
jgi:hypothetical protein